MKQVWTAIVLASFACQNRNDFIYIHEYNNVYVQRFICECLFYPFTDAGLYFKLVAAHSFPRLALTTGLGSSHPATLN